MFPASRRGRALELCLLVAVTVTSACASMGPATAPMSAPGLFARSPSDSPIPGAPSPMPGPARPIAGADSPSPRTADAFKPWAGSPKSRPQSRKSGTTSAKPAKESAKPRTEAAKPKAEILKHRPGRVVPRTHADSIALELAVTKRLAHRPLALALTRRVRNPELADRVASAVVYEAGRARMSPSLLAAVLLIENAPFDSTAVSTEGAIGLMQVMPVHVGSYRCLSGDLLNIEANICHGARLLGSYLRRTKSVEQALRRYNGCVRGRNTPRCHRYPIRVMRTASRLRHEILVTAAKEPETDLPSELDDTTSGSGSGDESNQCSSLLGCLRRRWSLNR
jgi:soluble lytic murein transglycosylase-like protein